MYPILLNAAATLAESATALLDSGALQAPYRAPMLIEGARFTMYSPPETLSGRAPPNGVGKIPGGLVEMGGSIYAQIRAGRFGLTNGFVPTWLFGPQIQSVPMAQTGGYGQLPESVLGEAGVDSAAKVGTYAHYLWKFPRPLYLPEGTPLIVQLQRSADGFGGSVPVNVGFVGKVLTEAKVKPRKMCVPWVTSFVPTEGVANAQSSEMQLGNPFQVPLYVQRLCGRVRYRKVASSEMYDEGFSYYDADTAQYLQTKTQVKIEMNHGPAIVRDLTQFYDVFDANRRAWNVSTILQPKQRFDAVLTSMTSNEQPQISLVGYREEMI